MFYVRLADQQSDQPLLVGSAVFCPMSLYYRQNNMYIYIMITGIRYPATAHRTRDFEV